MQDLGDPGSYLTLSTGVPVFTSDGEEIGRVSEVLADGGSDVFEGLMVRHGLGHRFVAGEQVEEIFDRGVVLRIDAAAADALPTQAPSAS